MNNKDHLRTLLREYIINGLTESDSEQSLQYVSDDIIGIGLGDQGIVKSKDDMRRIIIETRKSEPDVSYEIIFEQEDILFHSPNFATACAKVIIKKISKTDIMQSGLFQSALFQNQGSCWKICSIATAPLMISAESIEAYPLKIAEQTLSELYKRIELEAFELLNANVSSGVVAAYVEDNLYPCYFVNEGLLELLGYTREEFDSTFAHDVNLFIHPLDREIIRQKIGSSLKNHGEYQMQMRLLRKDGSTIWVVENCRLMDTKEERPLILSVFTDITNLIQMQQKLEGQTILLEEQAAELTAQNEELITQSIALAEKTHDLKISEERFHIVLKNTNKIVFDYDVVQNKIIYASNMNKSLSIEPTIINIQENILQNQLLDPAYHDTLNKLFENIQLNTIAECVLKVKTTTDDEVWYKISLKKIPPSNYIATRAIGLIEDITEQKNIELSHAHEEKYRQLLLEKSLSSYSINFSKNQFESYRLNNPDCIKIYQGDSYDFFADKISTQQLSPTDRLVFMSLFSRQNILQSFKNGKSEISAEFEFILRKNPSINLWLNITLCLGTDNITNEIKGLMYFSDINKEKREKLELAYKSEHDSLTGVYNKGAAEARIQSELDKLSAVSTGMLLLLDIDHFKVLNDTYGHPFGDNILVQVAHILTEQFRDTDIIGRIGGDEFCVFFCGIRSQEQIESIAEKICTTISALSPSPAPQTPNVSCSIGLSGCYGVYKNFAALYKEADDALYKAKSLGRNRYNFFGE